MLGTALAKIRSRPREAAVDLRGCAEFNAFATLSEL